MLRGSGRFVDDIADPHAYHLAFVRSPVASGRITEIVTEDAVSMPGVVAVLTSADLGRPSLTAVLEREEFVPTTMPLLAIDRVRYAGEPIVAVVAEDRYLAEDAADNVWVEIEEMPAVLSLDDLGRPDLPVIHDEAPDGVLVDLQMFTDDLLDDVLASAPLVLDETFRSGRVTAAPMESRTCRADWRDRDEQLVLEVSTQVPHQVRSGVAQALGLRERKVRVIAPDVGGGFGQKCVVGREEVVAAAIAVRMRHAVRWSEDRQENLIASFHGREQEYRVRAGFDDEGRFLGLEADIRCNIGAYSAYPFSCAVEPLMAATELPGVYKVGRYAARARGFASNKPPTAPYRGVSRPQIVLVMERLMDKAARRLGLDRVEIRRRNTIQPDEFPYLGPNGITYEPGSYVEALELCVEQIDKSGWPEQCERQDGLLRGIGIVNFSERTAYGTATMGMRKMQMTPGFEVSHVRMDASGDVVVTSGTCGHGQGHETTFAQIVADVLAISPDRIKLRQGDTDVTSFGWGTFASRSLVIGGGSAAVAARRLADQLREVAAEMLEAEPTDIELVDGHAEVRGAPDARLPIDEIAATVHFRSHTLVQREEQLLEARGSADPPGMFSNAAHAALVEVDPGTGDARVVDYIVVEDCGVVINPMIVDGQVRGGVAQGIGSALYEEMSYSPEGQPLTGTFMDYMVPTASEIPRVAVHHLETPCDQTETGAKGMGEGGTIGAPAAVLSALNDALSDYGADIDFVPVRPTHLLAVLEGTSESERRLETA
ncbi:MAG: xanthine dehydrogenase family protein molybdopterin-binding subunit [Actinomycetota bacterium]|nr:xanthine dehydrogenase family protein molybdopterin-binding subunit [Actinomycetota bacterium]